MGREKRKEGSTGLQSAVLAIGLGAAGIVGFQNVGTSFDEAVQEQVSASPVAIGSGAHAGSGQAPRYEADMHEAYLLCETSGDCNSGQACRSGRCEKLEYQAHAGHVEDTTPDKVEYEADMHEAYLLCDSNADCGTGQACHGGRCEDIEYEADMHEAEVNRPLYPEYEVICDRDFLADAGVWDPNIRETLSIHSDDGYSVVPALNQLSKLSGLSMSQIIEEIRVNKEFRRAVEVHLNDDGTFDYHWLASDIQKHADYYGEQILSAVESLLGA